MIGIVYSSELQDWKSCQKIVKNLYQSYASLLDGTSYFDFKISKSPKLREISKIAKNIIENKVDELVFIDSKPHPLLLLKKLSVLNGLPQKISFHLFGDFILELTNWDETFQLLANTPIKIIVASQKQKELVSSVLNISNVHVCPFPVDSKEYFFDHRLRKKQRAKFKIKDTEIVFFYTGRISEAKHCLKLVNIFSEISKKSSRECRLYLAGSFDDISNPVVGRYHHRNYYQFQFLHQFKKLPGCVRKKITFLGNLSDIEINNLSNMGDVFVSFSLYHDEDYGMSPIEALMSGCRAILTDWGGYHSFSITPLCTLVETQLKSDGAAFNEKEAFTQMMSVVSSVSSSAGTVRKTHAKIYEEHFSIESVKNQLIDLYFEDFSFYKGLTKLGKVFISKKTALLNTDQKYNNVFMKLYNCYASEV